MTPPPDPDGEARPIEGLPVEDGDGGDGPIGDTTVRRPRVPAPADPVADTDQVHDTIVARRGLRGHEAVGSRSTAAPSTAASPTVPSERPIGGVAAYASRVAAPVRGSRKVEVALGEPRDSAPDASEIRHAVRARARRRLAAVVASIVGLVIVLSGALIALVFAVGV